MFKIFLPVPAFKNFTRLYSFLAVFFLKRKEKGRNKMDLTGSLSLKAGTVFKNNVMSRAAFLYIKNTSLPPPPPSDQFLKYDLGSERKDSVFEH